MLKVSDARVKVRGDWTSEGSVLACTVTSTCHGIEVEIDLESEETPNRVAALEVSRTVDKALWFIEAHLQE